MKDFTYYYNNGGDDKRSLLMSDCGWLRNMGLRETRWILDREWLGAQHKNITFKKWIERNERFYLL